jgi:hypothetical protein
MKVASDSRLIVSALSESKSVKDKGKCPQERESYLNRLSSSIEFFCCHAEFVLKKLVH